MNQRDTLLVVDDMEINRAILRGVFERDFNILEAENGRQAMMLLEQYHGTIAAMLLDVVMPVKDGYQVLTEMGRQGLLSEVPVVVITAEGSAENEVRAFDLGASDIIMKPFEPYVVKRRVQNIVDLYRHKLHLEELVEEQARSLRESNEIMIDTLSSIIEYRSIESGQHVLRIRMFTKILLEDVSRSYQEYDLDERRIAIIASAAAMHDIGKIAIPDSILNKPGPLSTEEFEIMKTHSVRGCEILAGLDRMSDKEYLQFAYHICRYHHERWDGRGYPDGLKGDNIPICAQVVGLADCYDALTSDRVYKKAFPQDQAFNMILNGECGAFSPKLLECFKNVRAQFDELSREYADGRSPKADRIAPKTNLYNRPEETLDTLQLGQMKYFSLLRFMDATVMEADLDTGVYHLVYLSGGDFELLRTGSSFEESIRNFAQGAVYPRDREKVLELLGDYMQSFLEDGAMKRTRRYRVLERTSGEYRWHEATLLRIAMDSPRMHKVMLVWRLLDEQARRGKGEPVIEGSKLRSLLGGVQKCRNDKWFTLLYVSKSFTELLGYTAQEIKERFHDRYLNMIYPTDREEVLGQTRQQLFAGDFVELEYRVVTKEGNVIWVLDKSSLSLDENGEEYLYTVLLDVTQSKRAQEELRLTLERHKIILDQTNDIIFEWDIGRDQLLYSSNWEKKFGYEPVREAVSERIPMASHLHPEDIPNFMGLMERVASGVAYAEAEFRIAKADGRYIWCRIRATAQFDEGGRPIKAVGVILDIDSEKRASQALQDQAERDSLTRLYNKSAARRQVERYLEERAAGERGAMLIIDVDNFKQVNDRFGHMFGDAVLTEIAGEIRKLFRGGDIISRIGGDEFMVFMQRIPGVELAEDRSRQVIAAFQSIFRETLAECRLSCSIGVALCPGDGVTFQDLFQRADRALYRAKSQGKDQFVRYDHDSMDLTFGLPQDQMTAVGASIDSDDKNAVTTSKLVEDAFRMLYESGDVNRAVGAILELVGRQFNVSRAYIFERSQDGAAFRDTFEWCNEGITPGLGTTHALHDQDLGGSYPDNFNESGIFYCPDVAKLPERWAAILGKQGIQSMLQCAIRDDGVFMGYVGFDDCKMRRMWTREQIDAITFISELLSTFLLKKRAQERAEEMAEDLRMVLDNQNSWIYIIDPESYQLLYINAKTHEIAPEAREGMLCYRAFQNRETPCATCPMRESRGRRNLTLEFHNEHLGVWTMADACHIRWGGREACLLACHDITSFRQGERG